MGFDFHFKKWISAVPPEHISVFKQDLHSPGTFAIDCMQKSFERTVSNKVLYSLMLFMMLIQFPRRRCGSLKRTTVKAACLWDASVANQETEIISNMYTVIPMILLKHYQDSSQRKQTAK